MKKFDLSNIFNVKGVSARHKIINQFGLDKYDKRAFLNNLEELEKKAESGGESSVLEEKDVNFYDYDGTLLYSYTKEEALNLTELPPLPTQPGLICQGWNYDFDDAIQYIKDYGILDVGAYYNTEDGNTKLKITIYFPNTIITLQGIYRKSSLYSYNIDWGDNSEEISSTENYVSHTYKVPGNYCIIIRSEYDIELGRDYYGNYNISLLNTSNTPSSYNKMVLNEINLGNNIIAINEKSLSYNENLNKISLSHNCVYIALSYLYSIKNVVIPKNENISAIKLYNSKFKNIILSSKINNLISGSLNWTGCDTLKRILIPTSIKKIPGYGFWNMNVPFINIPKDTLLDAGAFSSNYSIINFSKYTIIPSIDHIPKFMLIIVPDNLYDEWINATNWADVADKIIKVSDYESLNQ